MSSTSGITSDGNQTVWCCEINVRAPDGRYVPVDITRDQEVKRRGDWRTKYDTRDIVGTTFRALDAFDYSSYGYEKIGNCWIDPENTEEVEHAKFMHQQSLASTIWSSIFGEQVDHSLARQSNHKQRTPPTLPTHWEGLIIIKTPNGMYAPVDEPIPPKMISPGDESSFPEYKYDERVTVHSDCKRAFKEHAGIDYAQYGFKKINGSWLNPNNT